MVVLGPTAVLLLLCTWLASRYAQPMLVELLGLLPVTFFAVGKFLPLWGVSGNSSFGPYQLGAVIWALDTFSVLLFVYSFEAIYRLPGLRKPLDHIQENMELLLTVYPKMKQASVAGVILFVLFPVSGTGALAASFIGVLLGMNRFVLIAAVSAGGCIGGFLMAFLAANFASAISSIEAVQQNPSVKYAVIGGLLVSLGGVLFFLNRMFRNALKQAKDASQSKS